MTKYTLTPFDDDLRPGFLLVIFFDAWVGNRAVVPDNGVLHVEERLPGAHLHSCLVGRNTTVEQTNEAACNELSVTTKKRVKAKKIPVNNEIRFTEGSVPL